MVSINLKISSEARQDCSELSLSSEFCVNGSAGADGDGGGDDGGCVDVVSKGGGGEGGSSLEFCALAALNVLSADGSKVESGVRVLEGN